MIATISVLLAEGEIDVSAHLPQATRVILAAIALLIAFFVVRPEIWRRMWFERIDPRPAALTRIALGSVVLWTFVDLIRDAQFLFTDQGIWLAKMARKNYGGRLGTLWDPEHGFEHWYDIFIAAWGKFSILHFRSDPAYVYTIYGIMLACLVAMVLGYRTRLMTVLSWILVEQVYRYSPLFYTGGDTVVRVMLFCGLFCRWGEAYSIDSWRRTRKAILAGATELPSLRRIPPWPQHLMMLQLCIIYSATGLLKSGGTWMNGTALYYSLCLDHFYRFPEQIYVASTLQYLSILPVVTVWVRWWEVFFPVVLIGVAVNAYDRDRAQGRWVSAPPWRRWLGYALFAGAWVCGSYIAGLGAYYWIPEAVLRGRIEQAQLIPLVTAAVIAIGVLVVALHFVLRKRFPRGYHFVYHWVLGRRVWLIWGFAMHIGIDLGLNVGTFAEVMMAAYFAWPRGDEVERVWIYLLSRAAAPGQHGRPIRKRKWLRYALAPIDRLRWRAPGRIYTVYHHPGEASVRQAALLRLWDLGHRLEFVADGSVPARKLVLEIEGRRERPVGAAAGRALITVMPGLWWLMPLYWIPVVGTACGALAVLLLKQRP